jgi:voltage-gated potassium channel
MSKQNNVSIRKYIHFLLDPGSSAKGISYFIDIFITVVIFINIVALTLETVNKFTTEYRRELILIELFSVTFFTIEYLLRLWVSVENEHYRKSRFPRLRWALTPMAVIDLLAILPFYIGFILGINMKFFLILRLFRLFKLVRYFTALQLMGRVFRAKINELLIAVFFILVLLFFISFVMYYVESKEQPRAFADVPSAMWWGIITLTTVGYGDVVPITPMGKLLGGCIAILGIGMFALPAGILASGFSNELEKITQDKRSKTKKKKREKINYCPNCGIDLSKHPDLHE